MLSVEQSTPPALTARRDFFISIPKDVYMVLQAHFVAFLLDKNRRKCGTSHV